MGDFLHGSGREDKKDKIRKENREMRLLAWITGAPLQAQSESLMPYTNHEFSSQKAKPEKLFGRTVQDLLGEAVIGGLRATIF